MSVCLVLSAPTAWERISIKSVLKNQRFAKMDWRKIEPRVSHCPHRQW